MKRAVITGMGAITPLGNSVNEFWENLCAGKSGAAPITRFDAAMYKTKFACEVKNFDPLVFIEKNDARKMDAFTQFALAATAECLTDSKLDLEACNRNKIAVIIASGVGGMQTFEDEILEFSKNQEIPRFNPFFITKMIGNIAAGQISIKYGLHGISYALVSACASSNHAIANALDLIRLGRANVVLAGGSEATITQAAVGGFNAMKALSTLNDTPEKASRPFDVSRDGFVLGEGAGILMIEEMEHALARNAKIYCELAGYGSASDAFHLAAPHPDGLGATIAMKDALTDAQLTPADVDYVNTHATSTPAGDVSECKAISSVFEKHLGKIHISATKSMTGHLLGAAGAIESVVCVKSLEHQKIHPTLNLTEIDPGIHPQLQIVGKSVLEKEMNVVINNTFGFGGHTVTTVFKKFKG